MLNRLISLVILLSFLNINIVYSETNFLLPQKKPSIFKKTQEEIKTNISKNLPVPKPRPEKKDQTKPKNLEKVIDKKPDKTIQIKKEKEKDKTIISSFIYPKKKPITYKVSSKEVATSKVLNKKDFEKAKETIKFIKAKKMEQCIKKCPKSKR